MAIFCNDIHRQHRIQGVPKDQNQFVIDFMRWNMNVIMCNVYFQLYALLVYLFSDCHSLEKQRY